jgi:septum site-determining protein MinC
MREEANPMEPGRRLLVVERTLRSGANIRYPGDVIVYGDVNAGAQIEAGGNIIVLGSLRGMAHAGAESDESATIVGFEIRPSQLRIGRKIGYPPDRPRSSGGLLALFGAGKAQEKGFSPEIAYVKEGAIVLEDWRGRLPALPQNP